MENQVNKKIKRQKIGKIFGKTGIYIFLTIIALIVIIPFYWMLNTSFKTANEAQLEVPTLYPHEWTFENYKVALLGKRKVEIDNARSKINEYKKTVPKLEEEIKNNKQKYEESLAKLAKLESEGKMYTIEYSNKLKDPKYTFYEENINEYKKKRSQVVIDKINYEESKSIIEQLEKSSKTNTQEYIDNKKIVDDYEKLQKDFELLKTKINETKPVWEKITIELKTLENDGKKYQSEYEKTLIIKTEHEKRVEKLEYSKEQLNVILPKKLETNLNQSKDNFGKYLINTLIVGLSSTIIGTFLSIVTAFALSRLNFKGKDVLFAIMMATMMIPGEMMVIANYVTVSKLGWVEGNELFKGSQYLSMVIPFLVTVFHIYLLRQNFKQIPDEMYYAAKIDGTSDWKYLWRIMVPLAKSSIITITILKLMGAWNAYIWPNLVAGKDYKLITVWLRTSFQDNQTGRILVEQQMAATVVVLLPLLFVFIFLRKYVMRGLSRGGIKG